MVRNSTFIQSPLTESTVHIWSVDLDQCKNDLHSAASVLSKDELERANRYYFEHDRVRYAAARMILRILLGWYENIAPHQLNFHYNDYGKPFINNVHGKNHTHFNVSHSQNQALFAFSRADELGIDIEFMRPSFATVDIAKRYFSPDELTDLQYTPVEDRVISFYDCWTRKEAYIKAKGLGLSLALNSFSVDLLTDSRGNLRRSVYYPRDESAFTIQPLSCMHDYRAALAINRTDYQLVRKSVDPHEILASMFSNAVL